MKLRTSGPGLSRLSFHNMIDGSTDGSIITCTISSPVQALSVVSIDESNNNHIWCTYGSRTTWRSRHCRRKCSTDSSSQQHRGHRLETAIIYWTIIYWTDWFRYFVALQSDAVTMVLVTYLLFRGTRTVTLKFPVKCQNKHYRTAHMRRCFNEI